jgi:hypothetical protein
MVHCVTDDKMPFLARLTLMFWLGLIFYIMLRLQAGDESSLYRHVSWNEFVHTMLAKGEVYQVFVWRVEPVESTEQYFGILVVLR